MNTYQSIHTGLQIDNNISKVNTLENKVNILETRINKINIYTGTLNVNDWEWYYPDTQMLQDLTLYLDKWYIEFFSEANVNSSSYDALKNATPRTDIPARYGQIHGQTTGNQFNVHYYRARATAYFTTNIPINVNLGWATDDEGACFVNGVCIGTNASCGWTDADAHLQRGCNEICIIWHENQGGEWFTTRNFARLRDAGAIQTAVPAGGYTQTITPTNITNIACTTDTILFSPTLLNPTFQQIEDLSKILNFGTSLCETNGTITVKTCANTKPEHDLNCYWMGFTTS